MDGSLIARSEVWQSFVSCEWLLAGTVVVVGCKGVGESDERPHKLWSGGMRWG